MTDFKTIFFWTSFLNPEAYNVSLGNRPLIDAHCPVTNCFFTDDEIYYNQSDVVLFDEQTMSGSPTHRFPHQRFVFYNDEAPTVLNPLPFMVPKIRYGFFNWTMTYRLDSDIVHRYGKVSRIPDNKPTHHKVNGIAKRKNKLVTWFVSHCSTPSQR